MTGKVLVLTLCVSQIYSQLFLNDLVYDVMKCDFDEKFNSEINPEKITFTFYNARIPKGIKYTLKEASKRMLENKAFSLSDKLNFYIGGFMTTSETVTAIMIKDAMLKINEPIVIVDYYVYCNALRGYIQSSLSLHNTGELISEYLIKMVNAGLPLENIYIMGHSLGAHLSGYIGREFERETGRKLPRITGMDPAGPCFDDAGVEDNINENDADYVDIYVFNIGQMGTAKAGGDAVFFVNGGGPTQPGCNAPKGYELIKVPLNWQCSHTYAMQEYWTYTIEGNGIATGCETIGEARRGNCDGAVVVAGFHSDPSTRGIYHVEHQYNVRKNFPW